jgi:hypothetical protein
MLRRADSDELREAAATLHKLTSRTAELPENSLADARLQERLVLDATANAKPPEGASLVT